MAVLPPLKTQARKALLLKTIPEVSNRPGNRPLLFESGAFVTFFNIQTSLSLLKKPKQKNKKPKQRKIQLSLPHPVQMWPWLCHLGYQFKLNQISGDTLKQNPYSDFIKGKPFYV